MSAEQIGGVAMMGMALASQAFVVDMASSLITGQTRLTTFSRRRPKSKIARTKAGKPYFRIIAYESSRHGLIIPKRRIARLPKTAISAMGTFFDPDTHHTIVERAARLQKGKKRKSQIKSARVTLPASTVSKMIFG